MRAQRGAGDPVRTSFAADVARGLPTAVTLAARDDELAAELAHAIGSASFRPYHSTDVRGVEIGGAAKNVLAIAAGIVTGRGPWRQRRRALTTRGFAELVRFGRAYGAKPETMMGLSGLGDLLLTCSSPQSRNFSLRRQSRPRPEAGRYPVHDGLAEGAFHRAGAARHGARARRRHADLARSQSLLTPRMTVDEAIESLLTRPLKAEA